jgi:hypothetical protein
VMAFLLQQMIGLKGVFSFIIEWDWHLSYS